MTVNLTVLAQNIATGSWGASAYGTTGAGEDIVRLTGGALTDVGAVGTKVVIDGFTVETKIAAGGVVLPSLHGGAFYKHYFDTFTAPAGVGTARAYYPLGIPVSLTSLQLVNLVSLWAAVDYVYISVWGRWQRPDMVGEPEPAPVTLTSIQWPLTRRF